ncbi:MAG: indole-3-glycerol phosphate synthase TrpC [Proteobacteria bacterium]|nr:indole-3-glycerol phosphate synthase TrpC [Pseudomonadota bacterium]MBU1739557.1 indole-3-glycerol phosphate synthase TrpC [Pseudomonadota bacterium]
MSDILDVIVARKREEVKALLQKPVKSFHEPVDPPRGFIAHLLEAEEIAVIAEAKKASPSKGVICKDFDPVKIAREYQDGGASALSVLTDVDFFQGSLDYIPAVRREVNLPVIRKDFIIHEAQIKEASRYGADAILLIAAILDRFQIRDYLEMAGGLGMDCLVEVHDEKEAEVSIEAGSRLIGVNNRNLRDFTVDLNTTLRVKAMVPGEIPVVAESGIRDSTDVRKMAENGVAAVLVGESLMRAADRAGALRELLGRS